MYEGKTGIKNRTGFAAGSIALVRFGGREREGESLRFGDLR